MATPANRPEVEIVKSDRGAFRRIPMSVPRRKMAVPDIPGYHSHWFLEENVPVAKQGGYDFVKIDEVPVNQFGVATDTSISGSADLGTNICIVGNRYGANGKPVMQYLMKIKEDWWREDQRLLEERNLVTLRAIFKEEKIAGSDQASGQDRGLSYVDRDRTGIQKPLFQRPARK